MASPNLSILIITYNRCTDCLELLRNIEQQNAVNDYVGEVLLLNNNSSDSYNDIELFAQNTTIPLKYIKHDQNLGVAGGRNFLIPRANFPYLLVLDDDVLFEETDAIAQISTLFEKPQFQQNNTAVITLNIFYLETNQRQQTALPHKKFEEYKDKDWFLTYYFTGAAHLMKRELFDKTGLYPQDFFYGMEEYDLSYRVIDSGYTLAYDSSVKMLHKESPLGRIPSKERMAFFWVNKSRVAYRFLPKIYFYTTAILWSLEYLKKTGFDWKSWLYTWKRIVKIDTYETRKPISKDALLYLKKVQANLWY